MEFQDTDSILAELEQQDSKTTEPQESSKPDEPFVTINYKKEMRPLTQSQTVEYAQKGFDYETKMSEFKKSMQDFESKSSKFQKWEDRYARMEEIDKYYQENPDKLTYLLSQYESVKSAPLDSGDPDNALNNKIATLEKTVQDLQGGYKAYEEEKKAAEEARIQTEIVNDLNRMKQEHPYLDWETRDGNNLKLEDFIIKHALDKKIDDVELATLQYCKNEIFSHVKELAKKEAVEGIKEGSKAGVSPAKATPKQSVKPRATDTSKSYEDLTKEAIAELEQGIYG